MDNRHTGWIVDLKQDGVSIEAADGTHRAGRFAKL